MNNRAIEDIKYIICGLLTKKSVIEDYQSLTQKMALTNLCHDIEEIGSEKTASFEISNSFNYVTAYNYLLRTAKEITTDIIRSLILDNTIDKVERENLISSAKYLYNELQGLELKLE